MAGLLSLFDEATLKLNQRSSSVGSIQKDILLEVQQVAGEDWADIEHDENLINAVADMISIRKMRERGEVPPVYTQPSTCQHCGPVWLWQGVPDYVYGCPWCFNRVAGKPIPRPTLIKLECKNK